MECLTQKVGLNLKKNLLLCLALTIILSGNLAIASGDLYDNCPGFRHEVVIPDNYYSNVPDALDTGNATIVNFTYHVDRIKFVDEDK